MSQRIVVHFAPESVVLIAWNIKSEINAQRIEFPSSLKPQKIRHKTQ